MALHERQMTALEMLAAVTVETSLQPQQSPSRLAFSSPSPIQAWDIDLGMLHSQSSNIQSAIISLREELESGDTWNVQETYSPI